MRIALVSLNRKDITNQRFGRLVVVGYSHTDSEAWWKCVCDCGKTTVVRGKTLRSRKTLSCGCLVKETSSLVHKKEHRFIDGIEYKECHKCGNWKLLSEFSICRSKRDGLQSSCKECKSNIQHDNRYKHRKRLNDWTKCKYKSNIDYKIKSCVHARMRQALKNGYKSMRTEELLGCPIRYLRDRLEKMFYSGMSWENYGTLWHIDHIRPCASFDLSEPEQQKICFHYINLQPLTAIENMKKGSRV